MFKYRKYIPITMTVLILLSAIITSVYLVTNWNNQPLQVNNTLATSIKNNDSDTSLKNIIHQSQKSVVQIESTIDVTTKTGSGFLINNDGDIITNAHVVKGADSIVVKLSNTREYPAAIVGIGEEQDFAVIRIPDINDLEPIPLETKQSIDIGDEIMAIGSPMGIQNSVSLGLIVGTDRSFTINDYQYDEVYQISANITHGNSGGPLILRSNGKVIGINSAGISDTDIGFSIPITQVAEKVSEWTSNVDEDELNYLSPLNQQVDKEKLEENATYVADYFFDNISLRDYVNAYSLLGSQYQGQTSYTAFRQSFQNMIDLKVEKKAIKNIENEQAEIEINVKTTVRNNNYEEKEQAMTYNVTIGYENDQLKILQLDKVNE
ncbi:S1C family serine protease [Gracilibacillus caseinilyticus]|uniref:S1C family serine protease n=1 Tax=Gracilibacillus caseinilyticus TaxID=2932256 RepID=A0ABY4F0R7_9BACI|nr:S1C family serine protease [Gracilibacillus caseinilyticus]UOQ48026.1 S1C family serine protease [Gracilibacillus caseinilyticus]